MAIFMSEQTILEQAKDDLVKKRLDAYKKRLEAEVNPLQELARDKEQNTLQKKVMRSWTKKPQKMNPPAL